MSPFIIHVQLQAAETGVAEVLTTTMLQQNFLLHGNQTPNCFTFRY
jgi:hypothetical protein